MADNLRIFGNTYNNAIGVKLTDTNGNEVTYEKVSETVSEPDPLDVDFIDYDGTLLYTYTAQEFLTLTALPANPSHEGLVAQGWNWTLADAKDFVGKYGALVVGQMYTTDTGRTRIYIHMSEGFPDLTVPLYYTQTVNSGTKVYWGDGTSDVKTGGTSNTTISHTYSTTGDYVIEIEVLSGAISEMGRTGANNGLVAGSLVAQIVTKIEIGNGVTGLAHNPFKWMRNMKTISFPSTLINQNTYNEDMFLECWSLQAVVFPVNYVGRPTNMFPSYSHAKYISVPKNQTGFSHYSVAVHLRKLTVASLAPGSDGKANVQLTNARNITHFVVMGTYTTIRSDTCRECSIRKIYIPETVTTIEATAFCYNKYCEEIHLYPTTPPTLNNTSAFNQTTGTFYVPYSEDHSILNAYKTATNWSTFADRMVEEPA